MKKHIFPVLVLATATFLLALPALHYGYLLEDYKYLRSYSLDEIGQTFYSQWEPTLRETRGYRPFHSIHYAVCHWLIGGDPFRNHILKTCLLIIVALLIYAFGTHCSGNSSAGFWIALVYICLGGNAWQASWLNHRHHILQVLLIILSLLAFDFYLTRRRILTWFLAFFFFFLAFLFKEEVATFPLVLAAYAWLVKGKNIRSFIRPLLPFFILALLLISMRTVVIKTLPDDDSFQPGKSLTPSHLVHEYGRSVFSTLIQTFGTHDPDNWEFPMYGSGLVTTRDYIGFLSLIGIFILGGSLLLKYGTAMEKKTFGLGIFLLLFVSIIVAAWYRNNRLYISSIGVALMVGTIASCSFRSLLINRRDLLQIAICVLVIIFLLTYLSMNLASFLEIQESLRPDGTISLLWDKWVYDEALPWMKPEQLEIFRDKLISSGRTEWAEEVSRILATHSGF